MERCLISTLTRSVYPFSHIPEFTPAGESLEVHLPRVAAARIRPSAKTLYSRFADFLPFSPSVLDQIPALSLGEGNTPLMRGGAGLEKLTGITRLLLKMESQNPTWSFKDRGSLFCVLMAQELGEKVTATISTGNMGHSISAYAVRAGIGTIVFLPGFAPQEKIDPMLIHGAKVVKVHAKEYSDMKTAVLGLAEKNSLRIVSGNGPIRTEGYKLTAFELFEQLDGKIDQDTVIMVPTSACGHIRGIFKGFRELQAAGYLSRLPTMCVVQARNNSPIVSAIKQGKSSPIPFTNVRTVAEAITSGNPMGGNEIIQKAREFGWLAEDVTEGEIIGAHRSLGRAGFFVEPSSATCLAAAEKLRAEGKIGPHNQVVMMMTGSGLKDLSPGVIEGVRQGVIETDTGKVGELLARLIQSAC